VRIQAGKNVIPQARDRIFPFLLPAIFIFAVKTLAKFSPDRHDYENHY